MENKEPKGIGGWLLIPTFSFIITTIIFIYLSGWFLVDLVNNGFDDIIFIIFIIFSFLSCFHVYTLILEFKNKKDFPKCAIALLWTSYVLILLMQFAVDGTITDYFGGIVGAGLWTWYFNVSKRVKNTFVK